MTKDYMYSQLLTLAKSPEFKSACQQEDLNQLEKTLINAKILERPSSNRSSNVYFTENEQDPKIEPRVAIAFVEIVVAGYVAAVLVTMVLGKNTDNVEPEVNNFNLKTPVLKNILALVSKFSTTNFLQSTFDYFTKIESTTLETLV